MIDWATEGGWQVFCAVLAWSRWRFVRFARDQKAATTLRLLAECFEELGGAPEGGAGRPDGLPEGRRRRQRGGARPPDYVRFATHFGFRPDFCEAADPESKGVVEALCRYAQSDLIVPAGGWADEADSQRRGRAWCAEVNGRVHSRSPRSPTSGWSRSASVLRPLPSLRPPLRRGEARKVDKLCHGPVRLGPLLGAHASWSAATSR